MEPTQKFVQNFISLQFLLEISRKHLRNLFLTKWKEQYGTEWKDNAQHAQNYFTKDNFGVPIFQKGHKTQQLALIEGNSSSWDISVLVLILSFPPFESPKWKNQIESIRKIRNQLAHSAIHMIDENLFHELSSQLTEVLAQFGTTKGEIDEILNHTQEDKEQPKKQEEEEGKSKPPSKFMKLKEEGNNLFSKKKYKKAIECYSRGLQDSDLSNEEKAILYCNRCNARFHRIYQLGQLKDQEEWSKALLDAKQAKSLNPCYSKAYYWAAKIYIEMEKLEKAKKNLDRALAFDPENKRIQDSLSQVKMKLSTREVDPFDPKFSPIPLEEPHVREMLGNRLGIRPESKQLDKAAASFDEMLIKRIPSFRDVKIGMEYMEGSNGNPRSEEKAASYFAKAARAGNPHGMYNLAILKMNGQGIKRDFDGAIVLLKQASACGGSDSNSLPGVAEAETALGVIYSQGIHVQADIKAAVEWYSKAVQHGSAVGALNLGTLYRTGEGGVPKDFKRAEELFLLANTYGDFNAAINLVYLYLDQGDPDQAALWQQRALEKRNSEAFKNNDEIQKAIQHLRESGVRSQETYEVAERENTNSSSKCDMNEIQKLAQRGSKTAEKYLRAKKCFLNALDILDSQPSDDNALILNLYEAYEGFFLSPELVCVFPSDSKSQECFHRVTNILRNQGNEKSEINEKTRACFAALQILYSDAVTDVASSSLELYPRNLLLRYLRAEIYSKQEKMDKCLQDINFALSIDPNNADFLYLRSEALKKMKDRIREAHDSFKEFLSKAPKDHLMAPEAYYALAHLEIQLRMDPDSAPLILADYWNKGMDSEEQRLGVFPPFESMNKTLVEKLIEVTTGIRIPPSGKSEQSNETSSNVKNYLESPIRHTMIKGHRQYLKSLHQALKTQYTQNMTLNTRKKQSTSSSLAGLKEIYFRDIDFSRDEILQGCVLTVTNFDECCCGGSSVAFVVEDANHDMHRLAIYNLGDDFNSIRQRFPLGVEFSVVNPYARMAMDGKPVIRVDDPNSVILTGRQKNSMCRFCGKENAKKTCSRCLKAKYCNKSCQRKDWNLVDHKLVCHVLSDKRQSSTKSCVVNLSIVEE